MRKLREILRGERGQGTVEYLMMIAVIVGVVMVVGTMFKPQISGVFNSVMASVADAARNVSAPR
ncbi:Flp family type IVb pilin [Elusimicrobiota bacterium]